MVRRKHRPSPLRGEPRRGRVVITASHPFPIFRVLLSTLGERAVVESDRWTPSPLGKGWETSITVTALGGEGLEKALETIGGVVAMKRASYEVITS